ncbi:MAG: 5'-nucleotidase C-terminal domain-containing protein [Bacillota bacterium]|nr:5'-nucleotidase C-terminal domain-containing protein [Bacillota bacterium]
MKNRKILIFVLTFVLVISTMVMPAFAESYTVQSGDVLWRIAETYGVTVDQLVELNNIENRNLIYPGEVFQIPGTVGETDEEAVEAPAVDEEVMITIVHTNDTHARVEAGGYDGMGFERVATIVKQMEAANPNTLVLDAGDAFHGQTIAQLNEGESIIKIFNEIGYDAMTPGNHDFNYGKERLLELDEMAEFPIVAANVMYEDYSEFLPGYTIKEVDGVKIGIFGISTPETKYKSHPKNTEGLDIFDPVIASKFMVAKLEDDVDVIVGLVHLGLDESSEHTSRLVAENVEGIDILVDGHSHSELTEGLMVGNTLIAQAGGYDNNVGIIDLVVKNGMVASKTARLINKEEAADLDPDPAITAIIAEVQEINDLITEEFVVTSDIDLEGERENVRTGETNLGNLITDAMVDFTGADVALTNGGGIRASIPAGDITVGDVITVLPFGNYVVTIDVTGAELVQALEHGLSSYPETLGAFPHISGMNVVFDPSQEVGSRVVEVTVDGEELDPEAIYSLATNDFLGAGGDDYTMFGDNEITALYPGLDEILIDYIREYGTEGSPVEGRIQTVDEVSYLYLNTVA